LRCGDALRRWRALVDLTEAARGGRLSTGASRLPESQTNRMPLIADEGRKC